MRTRYQNDGLGEMRDGDVLKVHLTMMDSKTPILDAFAAGFCRPGFRSSVQRDAARQEIADAYRTYDEEVSRAYLGGDRVERTRTAEERLQEAKETAEEDGPMRGRSDPSDPKYKAYRRKQTKKMEPVGGDDDDEWQSKDAGFLPVRPLRQIEHGEQVDRPRPPRRLREREEEDLSEEEREDEDVEKRTSDGRLVCDGCDGSGYCPGCDSGACPVCHGSGVLEDPDEGFDEDDDEPTSGWRHWRRGEGNSFGGDPLAKIQREATTSHEGTQRSSVPDTKSVQQLRAQHAKQMDKLYADSDAALREAWRKGG
jgi:hypothetical protein